MSSVVIVSGLPRSGTSLVMAMLEAGGVPALTDGRRPPDADNPNGYRELDAVKHLATDATFLASADGRAVKIVVPLVRQLPVDPGLDFHVIMVERDLDEVLASQAALIERKGLRPALAAAQLKPALARQWEESRRVLTQHPNVRLLVLNHRQILAQPAPTATQIATFLPASLDTVAMARVVDPRLYRQRMV